MEEMYFAGGCLWGVQEFIRHLPGVLSTQAGRANGRCYYRLDHYDGYAECVLTRFDPQAVSVDQLMDYFFEIIDPYSINKQGDDIGEKYRSGVYSLNPKHLEHAQAYIGRQPNNCKIQVEVLPLSRYVPSDSVHQDRLTLYPDDYCHIPLPLLHKYKNA